MAEFSQYREITAKLKKRFTLRKPNFREAAESFKKLSGELSDFKDYAGYCMLSAAQCEHNIVGSLREQQLSSSSTPFSSSPSASTSSPRPGSAVASNLFLGSGSHGLERVLQTATLTEFQTFLDTARLFKEADEVNAAISAFAHASQICPESILPILYSEWADMYRAKGRYFEAAEIFIEGGLIREAIDCLLSGQYHEDAYHCYQELFKLATKDPAPSTKSKVLTRSESSVSAKSPAISRPKLPSFFGRQKTHEPSKAASSSSEKVKSTATSGALHQPPPRSDGGPFADTSYLTIDDYITTFLLRLYLYDPVTGHEYPSPIIPLPSGLMQSNLNFILNPTNRTNADEEDDPGEAASESDKADPLSTASTSTSSASGTGGTSSAQTIRAAPNLSLRESFLPFVDFLNSARRDRTIAQLIELNMLLETMYLSYRHELRHTIDHDYANEDTPSWLSEDSSDASDTSDSDLDYQDAPSSQNHSVSSPSKATATQALSQPESSEVTGFPPIIRQDSVDDDPPTATTTTTTNATSSSASAFEKNDLDDISLKLQQLAFKFGSKSGQIRKSSKNKRDTSAPMGESTTNADVGGGEFADFERKLAFQLRMQRTEGDNDATLRRQIASKLFPLLNSHQNQLVYLIVKNKD